MTNPNWTPEAVHDVAKKLLKRSSSDADFRRLCLNDPAAAIKEISGMELPQGARPVRFVDPEKEMVYTLPAFGSLDELDETELEAVAGGSYPEPIRYRSGTTGISSGGSSRAATLGDVVTPSGSARR